MNDKIISTAQTIKDHPATTSAMELKDWLSLIALFLSAIVAVIIGQYLQDRKAKRDRIYQNKFSIFATILGLRHSKASNEQFVIAINQIPIVFHSNKEVLVKLDRFIKTHVDLISPKEKVLENLNSDLNDLVLEIAKDLGYPNIDNNVMKTFYYPDASYFRDQSDLIYNEMSTIEKLPQLINARENKGTPQEQNN